MDQAKKDMRELLHWFQKFRRDLPWRQSYSPYRVWVSEVMLQQTQVSVVIPYFERWMELFPTLEDLAQATVHQVIKAWEGLGYYSRARNLHLGAREIVEKYKGQFPKTKAELLKIKGLGPYTAGAILAFAYQQRAAAVDGNVRRVLARYDGIEEYVELPRVHKWMEKRTLELLPDENAHTVMEGLIELGALVCQKVPKCAICPIAEGCSARKKGLENQLPLRKPRPKTLALHRLVAILVHEDSVLVCQGQKTKVMADLWHFPFYELNEHLDLKRAEKKLQTLVGPVVYKQGLDSLKHGFTRYMATLYPHVWEAKRGCEVAGYTWVKLENLLELPFCAGHRTLAYQIISLSQLA